MRKLKAKNYMNNMMYHIEHREVMYISFYKVVFDRFINLFSCSNLVLKFGTTIDDMLKIYLKLKGIEDINNYNENIPIFSFSMPRHKIGFGDKTPIEIFFKDNLYSIVEVNLNKIYPFINYKKFNIDEVDEALLIIYFNQIFYDKNTVNKSFIGFNNIKSFKIDNILLNKCLQMRTRFYERLN